MNDAPIIVPFVPTVRPSGWDRLGLGQVAARPESARPLNAPEATAPKHPFEERWPIEPLLDGKSRVGSLARGPHSGAEWSVRARIAAASRLAWEEADPERETPVSTNAARKQVDFYVRLALPDEEARREFNIIV